ncbi:FHS family L-fucose permease-like MFS transporter [Arcicella aurantiaca]|uniref:FHS family L-fucose permease-like MFS transporter n=1 Tax=Arcicella aurantiaca TaxID=591202 RepID=A0A316DQK7_9BACT|nr:L-fucose:H+ symporter permease [Arcicella aurantiaca]PWK20274.1 FHS family L-fucose permease-like MFS transporter [Arcicella aurantiaca]
MKENKPNYLIPFILVTCLFFLWGIANNLNGVLIPHLRKALQLSNMQSTFVDTAVYMAYFMAAIPAGMIIKNYGYKKGIITGLLVFSVGAFLFIPAANTRTYEIFLLGLFIIGCGLTILETAANPYATKLGDAKDATTRLNLAQSFNGLAAFIAPMVGTIFILSGKEFSSEQLSLMPEVDKIAYLTSEAASVKMPYIILGSALLILAIVFLVLNFPEFKEENESEAKGGIAEALKRKHLVWAVVAQFFYVGAQVCVTSFFIRMAISGGGVDEKTAGYYLGIYGLLFMSGRFIGTIIMRYIQPARLLTIYAGLCILLSLVAVYADGKNVVLALGGLGFFMSIMFPTIFSLGIKDLNENTKPASSLIVMSIIGGAIFPVIMGKVIDSFNDNIQVGYCVPLTCFFVVFYFGLRGYKPVN